MGRLRNQRTAAAILVAGVSCLAVASPTRAQDASRQELLYDLSVTEKMRADEAFLNGERSAASAAYIAAKASGERLRPEFGFVSDTDIALLRKEIEYRQKLLEAGQSFWGFELRMRPINPIARYRAFQKVLGQYEKLTQEIDQLAGAMRSGNNTQIDMALQLLKEDESGAISSLESDAAQVQYQNAQSRRQMVQDRVTAIQTRQVAIGEQRGPLLDQMDAVGASLDNMLLNAAAQAAGVPPNTLSLLDAVARNDVSGALQNAALSYAAGGGVPELKGALGDTATTIREAAQTYKEIHDTYDDAQKVAGASVGFLKAVQSGSTRDALRAGAVLYDTLPAETRSKLTGAVAGNRTVEKVLTLARQGSELRGRVSAFLAQSDAHQLLLKQGFDALIDLASDDMDANYARMLDVAARASAGANGRVEAVSLMMQGWASSAVEDVIPETALRPLAQALGLGCSDIAACKTVLLANLKQRALPSSMVKFDSTSVVVSRPGDVELFRFDYKELADRAAKRPIDILKATAKANAGTLSAKFATSEREAGKRLLEAMPDLDFDRYFAPLLKPQQGASEAAVVNAIVPRNVAGRDILAESAAKFALGRDVITETVHKQASTTPVPAVPPPAPGAPVDQNQQMLETALAASGPYGAAAVVAMNAFRSLAQLDDLADQAERLDKEDKALTVELLHLAPLEVDIQKDEALAEIANRIARTRAGGARQRGQLLRNALEIDATANKAVQAKIQSRLPLAYYYLELLRENFAYLNQGVAQWQGRVGTADRRLEDILRADPRSQRLAIDPDVRLYDWFRRDGEGQRKDLDKLLLHWREVAAASDAACGTVGCSPETAEMGSVEVSPPVLLSTLLPAIATKPVVQKVSFTLLPQHLALPEIEGLRVVSAGALVRTKGSSQAAASTPFAFRLRHSGVGYVVVDGVGQPELLDASETMAPTYLPTTDSEQQEKSRLQARWHAPGASDQLGPLEGQPLFGLYGLEIPAGFNFKTSDLALIFFYQRPHVEETLDARALRSVVRCTAMPDSDIAVTDVRLLLRPNARQELRDLVPGGADAPACTVEEVKP